MIYYERKEDESKYVITSVDYDNMHSDNGTIIATINHNILGDEIVVFKGKATAILEPTLDFKKRPCLEVKIPITENEFMGLYKDNYNDYYLVFKNKILGIYYKISEFEPSRKILIYDENTGFQAFKNCNEYDKFIVVIGNNVCTLLCNLQETHEF